MFNENDSFVVHMTNLESQIIFLNGGSSDFKNFFGCTNMICKGKNIIPSSTNP